MQTQEVDLQSRSQENKVVTTLILTLEGDLEFLQWQSHKIRFRMISLKTSKSCIDIGIWKKV